MTYNAKVRVEAMVQPGRVSSFVFVASLSSNLQPPCVMLICCVEVTENCLIRAEGIGLNCL